jgi:CTP synthase
MNQNVKANVIMIDGEKLEQKDEATWQTLKSCKAIVVPGGFGGRAIKGKIMATKYARENNVPFLGICLGMQMAVVEFAQNVCNLNLTSREILEAYPNTKMDGFIVDYMHGQSFNKAKGGTMRLGNYECVLKQGSKIAKVFGVDKTIERHRHRLEVQNQFVPTLEANGLVISGKFELENNNYLVEMIELQNHPYFVATQSHPEFLSRPTKAHPLFAGLIAASLQI